MDQDQEPLSVLGRVSGWRHSAGWDGLEGWREKEPIDPAELRSF